MRRVDEKRYSKCIFSGYKSQQEIEEYLSRNYPQEPVVVVKVKDSDDYAVYFEDEDGEEYLDDIDVD